METTNTTEKESPWLLYVSIGIIFVLILALLIPHEQQTAQSVSSGIPYMTILTTTGIVFVVGNLILWWNIIGIILYGNKALKKYLNEPSKIQTQIQGHHQDEKVSDENDKISTRSEDGNNC